MTRAIVLASALLLAAPAFAAEKGADPKPGADAAADAAVCTDDAQEAAQRAKREAALAELGRRLAAEARPSDESRALNRTGFNYDPRGLAPAVNAPPPNAAPDTERR